MKCGGCVGHVKKILEAQPGVASASVNLATETALVRVMVPRGSRAAGAAAGAGAAAAGGQSLVELGERLAQVGGVGGGCSGVRVVAGGWSYR